MCLIAYSPSGLPITRAVFDAACYHNDDGIGVMAADDVARYVGRHSYRRAWEHIKALGARGNAFAVHWRFATHGEIDMRNCHPHVTRNGVYVMHNGVLDGFSSKGPASDTAQYIDQFMSRAPSVCDAQFYDDTELHIGFSNKFVVMDTHGNFRICNEACGDWIKGTWYSNTYSLPQKMQPYKPRLSARKYARDLTFWGSAQEQAADVTEWKNWFSTDFATTNGDAA